jgi:hypothetical protein
MLPEYSIQLVRGGSYDYEFFDKNCFMDRHKTLQESIDMGLEFLSKQSGDYFLFDGGDDTSLIGSYDVFKESNALGLFRPQLLSQEDYKIPFFMGMWFRTDDPRNKMSFDIPDNLWRKIKLSGYNLGHAHPNLTSHIYNTPKKDIDVVGIWQIQHKYNVDYGIENYQGYTNHRTSAIEELAKLKDKFNTVIGQYDPTTTRQLLSRAKIAVSPFGQGELCFRDFEIVQNNTLLIKPDISKVKTKPDWLTANETYIPVKLDWSDLNEKIEEILGNYNKYLYIIENAKQKMLNTYKLENVCQHWYDFFSNLNGIENE